MLAKDIPHSPFVKAVGSLEHGFVSARKMFYKYIDTIDGIIS